MGTAGPMNHQNDLGCIVVNIGHYFTDYRADDPLLELGIRARRKPDPLKIGPQGCQIFHR